MKGMKDSVQVSTPTLHEHNFAHRVNTSVDFFQFRPLLCEELYPKDNFDVTITDYFRAAPMAGAAYGTCYKKYAAFFVPYRILWDKWCDYLTGGSSGKLTFSFPRTTLQDFLSLAIETYNLYDSESSGAFKNSVGAVYRNMLNYWSDLGVPTSLMWFKDDPSEFREDLDQFEWPLLKFLACRRIWFDWYRDQNLIGDDVEDVYCNKDVSGVHHWQDYLQELRDIGVFNSDFLFGPLPVPVEKDYFTTAMLEPQRGGAAFVPVSLPSVDVNPGFIDSLTTQGTFSNTVGYDPDTRVVGSRGPSGNGYRMPSGSNDIIGMFDYNLVRVAKGVQKYLEKNNIAGGADLQQLLAHWGTAPNPAVFQRSTYIGSYMDYLNLEEVISPLNNSGDGQISMAGEVATKLNMSGKGHFQYTANEHGFFVVVQIIRPENTYVGTIRRSDLHGVLGNGRFDFFTPELEKTGNQPQYLYEVTDAWILEYNRTVDPKKPRGYVPRYAETKCTYNRFTGQLAAPMDNNLRIARDFRDVLLRDDNRINTKFTLVYGYPNDLQFDSWFRNQNPIFDHFDGWVHFQIKCLSERNEYAAPLIENAKGNDITLPYAGVRM